MNLKTQITKIHYDKNAKGISFGILKFLSIFYGAGSRLKNALYDNNILKSEKVNAYVISVGNVTTGGVGKTPVVSLIGKYFISKGEKTAINEIRKYISAYSKDMPGASKFRDEINHINSYNDFITKIKEFFINEPKFILT